MNTFPPFPVWRWEVPEFFNIGVACTDAHLGTPVESQVAMIVEDDALGTSSITYGELAARTTRFAQHLANLGVEPGDRVLVRLPNSIDYPTAFLGALKLGAIAVPTSTLLTAEEVGYLLKDSGATAMVIDEAAWREMGATLQGAGNLRYVISPRRAARARSWTRLLAAFESGEVVTGSVVEATKGGLIVDLGLRAFLPESLIDVRRVNKPAELIGQQVSVVVIECTKNADRPGERIVVSRKPIREKERAQSRQQLMGEITVGDRRRGRISALVPFGAFVDLGGVEGLIHVSELAHRQVAKPDDVVSVGDEVDVVVLEVNTEKRKIALSRKRALPDPWNSFQTRHQVGDLVFGTVTGLAPFGVFIALEGEELEGLVHISELSRFRVEEASEVVNVGEGVWVKILEIAPDKKRLALSLRRALE